MIIIAPSIFNVSWTPNRIPGLLAAWEADDPSITVTSGRASTVPGRYGTPAALSEFSGSGPAISATGWGGSKPCFVFTGTQYLLQDTTVAQALAGTDVPYTIIWASENSATVGNYCPWGLDVKTNDRSSYLVTLGNATYNYVARQSSGVVDQGTYAIAPTGRVTWACRFAGRTDYDVFRNGSKDPGSKTNTLASLSLAFDRFILGGLWQGSNVAPFKGNIGALWIYSRALTDTEITFASAKMRARWA